MVCVRRVEGKLVRVADPATTAQMLETAYGMYQETQTRRTGEKRIYHSRTESGMEQLSLLWNSGMFTATALEEVTGITRKTLSTWLKGQDKPGHYRGRIQPAHLPVVADLLRHLSAYTSEALEGLTAQLAAQGSSHMLLTAVLTGEEKRNRYGTRRTAVQPYEAGPDEQGHPDEGPAHGPAGEPDEADEQPGGGEDQHEAGDTGVVQGPPSGRTPPLNWTAPIGVSRADHDRLGLETRDGLPADLELEEVFNPDWDPYHVEEFGFDPSGDSYVQGGGEQGGSAGLPGFPAPGEDFERPIPPWERAGEA